MIPLAACSIVALAVVIDRAWTWWRLGRGRDPETVLARAATGEWTEGRRLGEVSRSPVARVLAARIRHRNPAPTLAMQGAARHDGGP
jgi:biopolymer transport protein ExbB